ncbi:hypothetical protein FGRMN_10360 [Fusarium graminum]|nr:hypothetical protein FGRMN_10360 [Fusarium graminum]
MAALTAWDEDREERFAALQGEVITAKENLASVLSSVAGLRRQMDGLSRRAESLSGQVNDLSSQVADLKEENAAFKECLATGLTFRFATGSAPSL